MIVKISKTYAWEFVANDNSKKNEYIGQIKGVDIDNEELDKCLTANHMWMVEAMNEWRNEIEEMKGNGKNRFHLQFQGHDK